MAVRGSTEYAPKRPHSPKPKHTNTMKLTIELPDRATPELLAFLALMMPANKSIIPQLTPTPKSVTMTRDEEQPTPRSVITGSQTKYQDRAAAVPAQTLEEDIFGDLEAPETIPQGIKEEDPTQRDLPFPDECSPPPPLPEGKTRWVCRGDFRNFTTIYADGRHVRYWDGEKWSLTVSFGSAFTHIEAI